MRKYSSPCVDLDVELTESQSKLVKDLIESDNGYLRLWDYKRQTVDALIRRGILTIVTKDGDDPIIQFRSIK